MSKEPTPMQTTIVLFDDVGYYIEFDNISKKCNSSYQFQDCLSILLTDKQQDIFTGDCTKRKFNVSKKRLDSFLEYLKDNIWNK